MEKDPKAVTEAEQEAQDKWDDRALRAAGELFLHISDDQKTHLENISDDPCKIWTKLETVHLQKKPGMRFNAWEEFFAIHMEENESLSSLMTRVDAAMVRVRNLRPDSFTIDDLDKELVSMTLIRSLPAHYSGFASSLTLLDKLDKDTLQAAFINEEALRTRSSTPGSTSVLSAFAPQSNPSLTCAFCSLPGHAEATCMRYARAKDTASKEAQEKRKQRAKGRSGGSAAAASTPPSAAAAVAQEAAAFASSGATESAGKASVRPLTSSPSPEPVSDRWTADSGATAHMTPHRGWLRNYTPCKIPVRLANHTVIFSAGVGSVVFAPEVRGEGCAVRGVH